MNPLKYVKLSTVMGTLGMLGKIMTPELKAAIKKSVEEWEAAAKKTLNPLDDMLVSVVKSVVERL